MSEQPLERPLHWGLGRHSSTKVGNVPKRWVHLGISCPNCFIHVVMRCAPVLATMSRNTGSLNIQLEAGCSKIHQAPRFSGMGATTAVLEAMRLDRRTLKFLSSPRGCSAERR